MYNVTTLGQVFTPPSIVAQMLHLRKNFLGRVLEPSCGDGAFFREIPHCVGIEIDPSQCPQGALNIDFFDYPIAEKFDTIIGNPPYVKYQDIKESTRKKLSSSLFDERSNLYLFFIEKSIRHLTQNGELIFITPRDFLKATSSIKLNQFIYQQGTITDMIDLGDQRIFKDFSPNCIIFRFERGNFSRKTNIYKKFLFSNGQLMFTNNHYSIPFNDLFFVKVGAVSGADDIFSSEEYGNEDFVCSYTLKTGRTKRMIFNKKTEYLVPYKERLLKRGIRSFDETNWWQWGRNHYISTEPRIYVNAKTRNKFPFFIHPCNNYDGSILAIFPKKEDINMKRICELLNKTDWSELGFVCDGRFIFSQRSLENALLPDCFKEYLPSEKHSCSLF